MGNESLDAIGARVEYVEKRIDEINDRLNDKEIGPTVLSEKLNNVLVVLGEVKQSVNDLKNRPSRFWDTLITSGIGALMGAMTSMIVVHLK